MIINFLKPKKDRKRGSFVASIAYIRNTQSNNQRIVEPFSRNILYLARPEIEMNALAALSRAADPVLHLVISYAKSEITTQEIRKADLERVLDAHELSDSQYYAVTHGDTDNLHVHVVANRVGRGGTAAKMSFGKQKNTETSALISLERDWDVIKLDKGGAHGCHVISRKHSAEQAKRRGLTSAEFDAYWESSAHTLSAWLGMLGSQTAQVLPGRDVQVLEDGREPFATRHGEAIRAVAASATSWRDFSEQLSAGGLDFAVTVKVSITGEVFPGIAYRHMDGRAGSSGSDVKMPYRQLEAKFGPHPAVQQARGEQITTTEMAPEEVFRKANSVRAGTLTGATVIPKATILLPILSSLVAALAQAAASTVRRKRKSRAETVRAKSQTKAEQKLAAATNLLEKIELDAQQGIPAPAWAVRRARNDVEYAALYDAYDKHRRAILAANKAAVAQLVRQETDQILQDNSNVRKYQAFFEGLINAFVPTQILRAAAKKQYRRTLKQRETALRPAQGQRMREAVAAAGLRPKATSFVSFLGEMVMAGDQVAVRTLARLGNAQQTPKATPETAILDVQQQSSKSERQPVSMPEKPNGMLIVQPAVPTRVIEPGQPSPVIIRKEKVSTPDRPASIPQQPVTLAPDDVTRMADEEKNNCKFAAPWSPDEVPPKMRAWYGLLARSDLTGGNIPHRDFTVANDKEAIATEPPRVCRRLQLLSRMEP